MPLRKKSMEMNSVWNDKSTNEFVEGYAPTDVAPIRMAKDTINLLRRRTTLLDTQIGIGGRQNMKGSCRTSVLLLCQGRTNWYLEMSSLEYFHLMPLCSRSSSYKSVVTESRLGRGAFFSCNNLRKSLKLMSLCDMWHNCDVGRRTICFHCQHRCHYGVYHFVFLSFGLFFYSPPIWILLRFLFSFLQAIKSSTKKELKPEEEE